MYVRTLYITCDPADVAPALDVIAKSVPGMLAQQPGFDGIGIFADRTIGKIITGSWWDSEQALQASDARLRERRTEMLAPFVSSIATMELQVAAYTPPAPATSGGFRLQRMTVYPGQADNLVESFRATGMTRLQGVDGFEGASLMLNRTFGVASVGIIFRDMDALAASRGPHAAIRKAAMSQVPGAEVIALEEMEVVELDLPRPKTAA